MWRSVFTVWTFMHWVFVYECLYALFCEGLISECIYVYVGHSPPRRSSILAMFVWWFSRASCSGLTPWTWLASCRLGQCWSRAFTHSVLPWLQASWRGVQPAWSTNSDAKYTVRILVPTYIDMVKLDKLNKNAYYVLHQKLFADVRKQINRYNLHMHNRYF